jgi:hypothetical protein
MAALTVGAIYVGCNDVLVPQGGDDGGGAGSDGALLTDADLGGGEGDVVSRDLDAGGDVRAAKLDCNGQDAAFGPPNDLGCTGLYADWAKRTLSPDAKEFDPGLRQWSDGAEATRWITLPAGQKIDTTDMNEWRFPIGTKLWEELRLGGRRVETRHFWKRSNGDWVRTTYRWSDTETTARSLTEGAQNVGGTAYAIPPVAQCDSCHAGRVDKVLGFDAVSLSSPKSTYDGKTPAMTAVAALLTASPAAPLLVPDDATGKAAPALGYLHANCGTSCHNPSPNAYAAATGLHLRLEVGAGGLGAYEQTSVYATAVCRASRFHGSPRIGGWARVVPGNAGKSALTFRQAQRSDPLVQMPPIASNIPDLAGVKLVEDWVQSGSFLTQTPCPQP